MRSSRSPPAPRPPPAVSSPLQIPRGPDFSGRGGERVVMHLGRHLRVFAARSTETAGRRIAEAAHHGAGAAEADVRPFVRLAEMADVVEIVVARAGVADQFPAREIAVAAVDRVGEKTFPCVLPQQ